MKTDYLNWFGLIRSDHVYTADCKCANGKLAKEWSGKGHHKGTVWRGKPWTMIWRPVKVKILATPGLVVFSVLGKEQLTWKLPAYVAVKVKITLLFGSPAGSKTRGMSWSGIEQGVVMSWKKQQTILVWPIFGSQVFGTQAMLSACSLKTVVLDDEEWLSTLPGH